MKTRTSSHTHTPFARNRVLDIFSWLIEVENVTKENRDSAKIIWSVNFVQDAGRMQNYSSEVLTTMPFDGKRQKVIARFQIMKDDIQSILPIARVCKTHFFVVVAAAVWTRNERKRRTNRIAVCVWAVSFFLVYTNCRKQLLFQWEKGETMNGKWLQLNGLFELVLLLGSWINEHGCAYGSSGLQGHESIYCFTKWKGCRYNSSKFVPFRRRECHKGMAMLLLLLLFDTRAYFMILLHVVVDAMKATYSAIVCVWMLNELKYCNRISSVYDNVCVCVCIALS